MEIKKFKKDTIISKAGDFELFMLLWKILKQILLPLIPFPIISQGKQSKVVEMMQKMCEKNEHLSTVFRDACRAMADYIHDENFKKKPGLLSKINYFSISINIIRSRIAAVKGYSEFRETPAIGAGYTL